MMHSFPVATALYYYKLGNLKHQKCIISQSEGQKSEIKVLAGPPTSRGSVCVSHKETCIKCRAYPDNPKLSHLQILILFTFTNTPFPNKATITDFWG